MNADGVSYADMSDTLLAADWETFVNAYWSPLYPVLLALGRMIPGAGRLDEFALIHLVNGFVFLLFWAGVESLLRELRRRAGLPPWSIPFTGWFLLWCGLSRIDLALATPDLLLLAIAVLTLRCALAWLRTRRVSELCLVFLCFGAGYLAKFIFLTAAACACGVLALGVLRKALPLRHAAAAVAILVVVAAPWVIALSLQKHRLTAGDVSRIGYSLYINGVHPYLDQPGADPAPGRRLHPPCRILDSPAVYHFGDDFPQSTFPAGYDPTRYCDGIRLNIDLPAWAPLALREVMVLLKLVEHGVGYLLFLTVLLSALLVGGRQSPAGQFLLAVPLAVPLALVSLLHVEDRLIAPFLAPLFILLFALVASRVQAAAARSPAATDSLGLPGAAVVLSAVLLLAVAAGPSHLPDHPDAFRQAAAARAAGVASGSRLAIVGDPFAQFWVRLVRGHIVAHVDLSPGDFRRLDDGDRRRILDALGSHGCDHLCVPASDGLVVVPVPAPPADR